MQLAEIKGRLRAGAYAWPGGYPLYFVTSDGAALSFATVRAEWRNVVWAHIHEQVSDGWHLAGVDVNWEDPALYDAHTGERIPSAYAEDEARIAGAEGG